VPLTSDFLDLSDENDVEEGSLEDVDRFRKDYMNIFFFAILCWVRIEISSERKVILFF
jgi:hypothetical protein